MKAEELQMFEYLIEIEPRLYDRFLTVERNVKAASNSFYDAYLDLQEQFIKTVAVPCGFDIKARETCGELLRRTDVQNYFKDILHIDDFTYNKMQDYTLKVNAHKHKGEKNIQIDTIVSYMKIFYNATKAFAVYKNIDVPDFDADCFISRFQLFRNVYIRQRAAYGRNVPKETEKRACLVFASERLEIYRRVGTLSRKEAIAFSRTVLYSRRHVAGRNEGSERVQFFGT